MTALNSKLAAYQSVIVHGGIAADDPHQLTLMLMDGALERIAAARGCLARHDLPGKAHLLQRTASIIAELRGSLDLTRGGVLAQNLNELYDYIVRQVLRANTENRVHYLDEIASLLSDVRSAWVAVPLALKNAS